MRWPNKPGSSPEKSNIRSEPTSESEVKALRKSGDASKSVSSWT